MSQKHDKVEDEEEEAEVPLQQVKVVSDTTSTTSDDEADGNEDNLDGNEDNLDGNEDNLDGNNDHLDGNNDEDNDQSSTNDDSSNSEQHEKSSHSTAGADTISSHNIQKQRSAVPSNPERRVKEILHYVKSSEQGLSSEEAKARLDEYGPNELPKVKENPVLKFLGFFWDPLAWCMEIAAIISIILLDYVDFALIVGLLIFNSTIAFYEEYSSQNAIAALEASLTPTCLCYRDGELDSQLPRGELVPGDVLLIRMGSIVPADATLLDAGEGLMIDQAALTGESLPVERTRGGTVYSGSIVKRGESKAVVHATGKESFFGKAAGLVAESETTGLFHKILRQVAWFCIVFIALGFVIELIVQFGVRKMPCTGVGYGQCDTLSNALVLIVGGVPIAMPTVLSVTLAIGAFQLAKKDAIVSHLTAIEELAAMDMLCSDKTGTLTKNELRALQPISYIREYSPSEVLFFAAAGVPQHAECDAIDTALIDSLTDQQKAERKNTILTDFHPFNSTDKATWGKVTKPDGTVVYVKKGAPQIILSNSSNYEVVKAKVNNDINALGKKGYRCIGISVSDDGKHFKIAGLIPLFDSPRDDTASTIARTFEKGITVKMITGDQAAIAEETARQLKMKSNIISGEYIRNKSKAVEKYGIPLGELIEQCGGFAEVLPQDKYYIVKILQKRKHIVGMTGDGVNDIAALKEAHIGIAVAGSTDAARAAADIVLKTPGLGVIVDAIIGSRQIFQRMQSYCLYSISMAVRVVLLFGILTIAYNWYFPTIAVVILALLNDGCMISISRDRTTPSETPEKWKPIMVFGLAACYGVWLTISSICLFEVAANSTFFARAFGLDQLNATRMVGLIYIQVSVGGLATIFVTRSRTFSILDLPSIYVVIAFVLAQAVASVIGAYGLPGEYLGFGGCGWGYVLVGWVWSIIWYIPMDLGKVILYRVSHSTLWRTYCHVHPRPQSADMVRVDGGGPQVVTMGKRSRHVSQDLVRAAERDHADEESQNEDVRNRSTTEEPSSHDNAKRSKFYRSNPHRSRRTSHDRKRKNTAPHDNTQSSASSQPRIGHPAKPRGKGADVSESETSDHDISGVGPQKEATTLNK